MGLQIQISISGLDEEVAKLKTLGDKLLVYDEAMVEIGEALKNYYSGPVFASQGGVLGVQWPTLAASTMLYKAKKYRQYTTVPLIATGAMKGSFKADATSNSVIVSNTAPYFPYHQSSAPRRKIPYRPMMAINAPLKSTIKAIIQKDIAAKIAEL